MRTDILFPADFLSKLERLAFVAKKIHRGRSRGEHITYRKGSSLEFYDYRSYRPGDDPRYIDWNIYERLGRLVTKLFSAEEDLTVHFLLDASASMSFGTPSKLLFELRLCAALSCIAQTHLDRVGITWFSDAPGKTLPPMPFSRSCRTSKAAVRRASTGLSASSPEQPVSPDSPW